MKKIVHVFYSGRVQGVCFRATTKQMADGFGVKGWVRNLSDGRVELVASQEQRVLNVFLEKVRIFFKGYIRDENIELSDPSEDFDDFQVKPTP